MSSLKRGRLSIAIMAHPKRKDYIPYLLDKLGKDTPVIWDEKNNVWDTCSRAWQAHDPNADYHLVIQDDAIVCDNFRALAEAQLGEDAMYSFYLPALNAIRLRAIAVEKTGRLKINRVYGEVAIALPTKRIADLLKYSKDINAQKDDHFTDWIRKEEISIIYPIPSLINHRTLRSLVREQEDADQGEEWIMEERQAYNYIDDPNPKTNN